MCNPYDPETNEWTTFIMRMNNCEPQHHDNATITKNTTPIPTKYVDIQKENGLGPNIESSNMSNCDTNTFLNKPNNPQTRRKYYKMLRT